MKPKQIIIVVIAFVLLSIIYAVQKSRQREVIEGLGYESVVAETLATSDIQGVKCYLAGQEDTAVHLFRQDDGWVVKSKFDAPAKESKVNELIKKLQGLKGELRSSSEDVLSDYGIDDDNALHLVLLDAEGQEKKRLLVGRQGPNWNEVFVRQAGSNDVYLVGENLRRDFGIHSEENAGPIDSKQWCELTVLSVSGEDLSRIELEAPHRRLVLERKEATEPVVDSESGEKADTEEQSEPPAKEWMVVEPELDETPKESGINRLTAAFANFNVSDVVARGGLESYGLEEPRATCTLTTQAGETYIFQFGDPIPDGDGAHYVRLGDDDLVYRMDRWKLDSIFIKMS
ncbi:MAG: DUF4340 domain-containing protein, partial [Candidatus Hydrogenedentota bacterium]